MPVTSEALHRRCGRRLMPRDVECLVADGHANPATVTRIF
jgi:hypothetical protein